MLRRNASQNNIKSQKIPIRTRPSKQDLMSISEIMLRKKYLQVSVGAFSYRNIQQYLQDKNKVKELQIITEDNTQLKRYMPLTEIKQRIKAVVIERVQRDYMFGIVFHGPFYPLLEKYQRLQRRLKQRNLYNRYYFSNCPPKISLITQPTATSLRGPQSNSTLQLQTLTKNLQAMLQTKPSATSSNKKVPIGATPEKRLKQKSQRSKKALKINRIEQTQQQNYGLKNYRKGAKIRMKEASRDKQSLFINIKYCVTPQPHASKQRDTFLSSPSQGRLSERKTNASKSGEKRRKY